jgi:hypothetical protein
MTRQQDKITRQEIRQEIRQDVGQDVRQDVRQDVVQDKTRQDKTRQDKTRQGRTGQDRTRQKHANERFSQHPAAKLTIVYAHGNATGLFLFLTLSHPSLSYAYPAHSFPCWLNEFPCILCCFLWTTSRLDCGAMHDRYKDMVRSKLRLEFSFRAVPSMVLLIPPYPFSFFTQLLLFFTSRC